MAWSNKKKEDEITKMFILNLGRFAKQRNIKIKDFCAIIGFQPSAYYRWKAGKVAISTDSIEKIQIRLKKKFGGVVEMKVK